MKVRVCGVDLDVPRKRINVYVLMRDTRRGVCVCVIRFILFAISFSPLVRCVSVSLAVAVVVCVCVQLNRLLLVLGTI